MSRKLHVFAGASAVAMSLSACGGGGGGFAAIPPPPPPPPPTPTPAPTPTPTSVTIFANPQPGTYTTVGVSAPGLGGYVDKKDPVGPISTSDPDQPHIRYTPDGYYEIQFPAAAFDRIVPYGDNTGDTLFTTAGYVNGVPPAALFTISKARDSGYQYSELAQWTSDAATRYGAFAFGVPTAAGAVPMTGSATYSGIVRGETDLYFDDALGGGPFRAGAAGTVTLGFDFANGSLSGSMALSLDEWTSLSPLGTFAFTDTVYAAGSTSYSGRFATTVSGQNWFLGQFTGPHAEETIGAWAVPFFYNSGTADVPADNKTHQAFGAWIAKKP